MTAYSATTIPTALYPGDKTTVWSAESPATGASSRQVALFKAQSGTAQGLSVELIFSGNPGTFEVDLQTSDTDADGDYVVLPGGQFTSAVASPSPATTYVARGEFNVQARFARLNMQNDPSNVVTTTANISQ